MRKLVLPLFVVLAAVFASAAHAAGGVAVGHSGWAWDNPQPQGETLRDIAFADGAGYAAGGFGTLLATSNGGLGWRALRSGTTAALRRVQVVDGAVIAGGGCALRRSDDNGATFERVRATTRERGCRSRLAGFGFVDATIGYAVLRDGGVKRTADGGRSFANRGDVPGAPADVAGLSAQTAVAVAGRSVYRSTDGGATWTEAFAAAARLNRLHFTSASVGYAVGDSNTLLRTADGGVTWTPRSVPASAPVADLTSIRCAPGQPGLCLIGTRSGAHLLRTVDGGASLGAVVPAGGRRLYAAAFASPAVAVAVAVGRGGATALSADGGQNWTPVGRGAGPPLKRLRASAGGTLGPGAGGTLLRREAGDWTTLRTGSAAALVDAGFANATTGLALEGDGDVLKTVDGGAAWTALGTATGARALFAADPRTVLAVGAGGLARSTGGGDFEPLGGPVLDDYDRMRGGLLLHGPRALLAVGLGGERARAIPRPGGRAARVRTADFLTARRGYVLNRDGRVWTTDDGGKRWRELGLTGTPRAYDMGWDSARSGWLAVDRLASERRAGYLLRTDDGGETWRPQLVAARPIRRGGLVVAARRRGLALAGAGQLFHTASGGDRGAGSRLTLSPRARRIEKARPVLLTGRIAPAAAGAQVYVSVRAIGDQRWRTFVTKPTSARGRFKLRVRIARSSLVVARWLGDAELHGDGAAAVSVRMVR